jgi:hypothetical protein
MSNDQLKAKKRASAQRQVSSKSETLMILGFISNAALKTANDSFFEVTRLSRANMRTAWY